MKFSTNPSTPDCPGWKWQNSATVLKFSIAYWMNESKNSANNHLADLEELKQFEDRTTIWQAWDGIQSHDLTAISSRDAYEGNLREKSKESICLRISGRKFLCSRYTNAAGRPVADCRMETVVARCSENVTACRSENVAACRLVSFMRTEFLREFISDFNGRWHVNQPY